MPPKPSTAGLTTCIKSGLNFSNLSETAGPGKPSYNSGYKGNGIAATPTTVAPIYDSGHPSGQIIITSSPFLIKNSFVLVSLVTMPSTLGKKVSVNNAIFTILR